MIWREKSWKIWDFQGKFSKPRGVSSNLAQPEQQKMIWPRPITIVKALNGTLILVQYNFKTFTVIPWHLTLGSKTNLGSVKCFILMMGLGQKCLTQVGSIFCCSGWVSHLWFGIGKFSLKNPNFEIFSLRIKKIYSGWV